jgi:hypothetical protein
MHGRVRTRNSSAARGARNSSLSPSISRARSSAPNPDGAASEMAADAAAKAAAAVGGGASGPIAAGGAADCCCGSDRQWRTVGSKPKTRVNASMQSSPPVPHHYDGFGNQFCEVINDEKGFRCRFDLASRRREAEIFRADLERHNNQILPPKLQCFGPSGNKNSHRKLSVEAGLQ